MGKWGIDCCENNSAINIQVTKDRWIKARRDLEDAKYIEELIHRDFINHIRNYKTTWDYRLPTVKSAVDELKITDGRKKKPSLSYLNSCIKEDFFTNLDVKIKVNNIISYGYEGYRWQMDFEINGEIYSISVPDKTKINAENLDHAYEGKFAFLHRTSECSVSVEFTDYREEKMAKYIEEYFTERANVLLARECK